ncbi:uncharacterized protein PITG_22991 [Phytophthora infestans T30-4]|uniref:Endonuclease/exonuclease/phosphatase domain-containing protein n=1 Tax=Phytophthora infestans (strain T30-4) TaxID=403677 RepID=D0NKA1_PHYIT|nr:uncharacterized protein PITG_22991 [Phytophthora infestans T30-4]EEY59938.1 conserved hypothetical protein [Phytophthora infestans T30-4]|eukprot:XP_002900623.1 conserved hypothetical protein [Phytophthora infestans T30-4]
MWGYKKSCITTLSLWSSGTARRAGVAILINPYGAVKDLKAWGEEHWTEHLVMATGEIQGKRHLFVNVYAPSHGPTRTLFFNRLRGIELPKEHTVTCGGDFNCVTMTEVDRSGKNGTEDAGARTLRLFLQDNALVDTGESNMPEAITDIEVDTYARTHHTYAYTTADGLKRTSRLDRWYISGHEWKQVRGVTTDEGICDSDHRGVLLEMHYPNGAVRVKKRETVYPPPMYVQAATKDMIEKRLTNWGAGLDDISPSTWALEWDRFKERVKKEMAQLKQHARRRTTKGCRQRISRLKRKLAAGRNGTGEDRKQREEWIAELKQVQSQRRALKRRGLINKGAWTSKTSTKYFFSRICTKYGDNIIPALKAADGAPRRGAHMTRLKHWQTAGRASSTGRQKTRGVLKTSYANADKPGRR